MPDVPEETRESDLSQVLRKHYERVKDWSPETLEEVLKADPDPEAQAWVQHLATLPEEKRRDLLYASGRATRAAAKQAFEETGVADELRNWNRSPLTLAGDAALQGLLSRGAVGGLTKGLTPGNLLKILAIGTDATGTGPIDLATGDVGFRPARLQDPSSVANIVGSLFNLGRARVPGLTSTPGRALATDIAEGFGTGTASAIAAKDPDPLTMGAAGGVLQGGLGFFGNRLARQLPKTGAEQLKPKNLDKFLPGMSQGEKPRYGIGQALRVIRDQTQEKLARQEELQKVLDTTDNFMSQHFETEAWLPKAAASTNPAVRQAAELYAEAFTKKLAAAPEKVALELASMRPKRANATISMAVKNMFSRTVDAKQLVSEGGADSILRLYEAKSLPPIWREAIRQNVRNFFLAVEPGSKASVDIAKRFSEVPKATKDAVNKIFKDENAFNKLVALRDAHDKFNSVAGPWTAITVGSRKSRASNADNRPSTSILTTIGNAAKSLSTENIAEAIMQKEGTLGKALAKWGEAVVSGKVTPNQLPRELVREIVTFVNTAGTPIRNEDLYSGDFDVNVGGRKTPVEMPSTEPLGDRLWRMLTGAATKSPGPKAEQRYAAGAPR